MLKIVVKFVTIRPIRLIPIVFLLLISSSCEQLDPVVKIGLVAPFEGRYRDIGYDVIYSARLAVREINREGGISGKRIALVAVDDFGNVGMAQSTAKSMVLDTNIIAVVGHWLPDTTEAGSGIYEEAGLPFIAAGSGAFGQFNTEKLPDHFRVDYEEVTPFDEIPGTYAASAYDAFGLLFQAMRLASQSGGQIDRRSLNEAMNHVEYDGITGHFMPSE